MGSNPTPSAIGAKRSSDTLERPRTDCGDWELRLENLVAFIELGFRHILPLGLDHILFVIALYLTSSGLRPLILQVTAFTIAHSTTLGLAAAGWIDAPAEIVEPLIALSIAAVGVEAALGSKQRGKWRLPVVFVFGLCHGLGFAAMMKDFMIGVDFLTALVGFNIGVELGQLTVLGFVGLASLAVHRILAAARQDALYPWIVTRPAGLVIAGFGVWWILERTGLVAGAA